MSENLMMCRVYMAQAKATPWPEFRSTLVRWARNRLHAHIREGKVCQLDMFGDAA